MGNTAPRISPLGDSAILIHFGDDIDLITNRRVHALDARLRRQHPPGILEMVPAYATLLLHYDPLILTCAQAIDWVRDEMHSVQETWAQAPRRVDVPVRYGGEDGPDLAFVASYHGASAAEIVRIHAGGDYTVFMMGFTPGFPYMGKLDDAIATPRLESPRTRVPVGSVGIAGAQTGIYPIESPGGWQLIGRTSLKLFDPAAASPFLFSPGDSVRFLIESLDA